MENFVEINNLIFADYIHLNKINLKSCFEKIKKIELTAEQFNFYNAVSVMSSSKIEGETMDIDSFVSYKFGNVKYLNSLVQKPNDLYTAYQFAQKSKLSKANFLKAHKIVSKHLLQVSYRGKIRDSDMIIRDGKTGKVIYEACFKEKILNEFSIFFDEVILLLKANLTLDETFFYASLLHLKFVKIHPFDDGNGRMGRLLEKWFLAEKIGQNAWFIQSELNYWNKRSDYYKNLSSVGFFYDKLDIKKSAAFLLMLPKAMK